MVYHVSPLLHLSPLDGRPARRREGQDRPAAMPAQRPVGSPALRSLRAGLVSMLALLAGTATAAPGLLDDVAARIDASSTPPRASPPSPRSAP